MWPVMHTNPPQRKLLTRKKGKLKKGRVVKLGLSQKNAFCSTLSQLSDLSF